MEQNRNYFPQSIATKAGELRKSISPEKEYFFGAVATYLYLSVFLNAENMPEVAKPLAEMVQNDSLLKTQMLVFILLAFLATIDGAQRIAIEKLPVYKAFIKVYLLNKKELKPEIPSSQEVL